ncbi:hypothetical protein QQ045_019789 [Rhodiola kirilowii]
MPPSIIEPTTKVSTRIDNFGSENSTWNDRFSSRLLPISSRRHPVVTAEIFALGYVRQRFAHRVIGIVRTYLNNILPPSIPSAAFNSEPLLTPSFTTIQIHRYSRAFRS